MGDNRTSMTHRLGYGMVRGTGIIGMRMVYAHRMAYTALVGPIVGELDHKCRIRGCCNPAHLDDVSHQENMDRAVAAKTHCRNGHAYADHGFTDSAGFRRCRICRRRAQADWRERQCQSA